MGSNSSFLLQKDEIQSISNETGFTPKQIKRLYNRFHSLDKNNMGYLTKQDLLRIPELHVNPLCDRIIEVLIDDYGQDSKLNFRRFAYVFSTFRRGKIDKIENNSKEKKLKFLFGIYDRNKDDLIDKQELLHILKMLVGSNIPEDQMNAIAERTIAELDVDGDNSITFEEFCNTLKKIDIEDKMSVKFLA